MPWMVPYSLFHEKTIVITDLLFFNKKPRFGGVYFGGDTFCIYSTHTFIYIDLCHVLGNNYPYYATCLATGKPT